MPDPGPDSNDACAPRRIAVLAVHGVGDHPPCASARAIGDMLAGMTRHGNRPKYSVFRENLLRLKVRKAIVNDHTSYIKPHEKFTWGPMNALATAGKKLSGKGADSLDHLFMEAQLSNFDSEKVSDTYQFLRLDGERLTGDCRKVHVYEMYWADLSRLGTGFTSIFSELYQLLFHLTSVGINNISAAAVAAQSDERRKRARHGWTCLRWLYLAASGIFAWPIAILNLFLAAFLPAVVGISLLRAYVSPRTGFPLVLGLYGAAAAGSLGALLLKFRRRLGFLEFALALLAPIAAAGAVWWSVDGRADQEYLEIALAVFLTSSAFIPIGYALQAYELRRPGSFRAAHALIGLYALATVWWHSRLTFWRAPAFHALLACMNLIEILVRMITGAWIAFALLYVATLLVGLLVAILSPAAERKRTVGTLWTAVLALVLPSLLFILVTLVGSTGILKVVTPLLPLDPPVGCFGLQAPARLDICYEPVFPMDRRKFAPGPKPLRDWADWELNDAGMKTLPALLIAVLLAMILAMWSFGPSVWDEVNPDDARSQNPGAFGQWLSCGFMFLYPAGWILVAAMTFVMTFPLWPGLDELIRIHAPTKLIGTLVAGAGAGLIGFRGRLSELAMGFRPVVRVMLDVDSWLREHPRQSNPTGSICARYVTLLRHICNFRDQEGRKHDALVIVAHSQGTVITADLLRFLQVEHRATIPPEKYDPGLERLLNGELPVYLFTMGCPLRQLYGLRFPYLYQWAVSPNPGDLGVRTWTNAFRSGDYIGRHIWRADDYPATASPEVTVDDACVRFETCIGAGAHTHYWDESAPRIAKILDDIVSGA